MFCDSSHHRLGPRHLAPARLPSVHTECVPLNGCEAGGFQLMPASRVVLDARILCAVRRRERTIDFKSACGCFRGSWFWPQGSVVNIILQLRTKMAESATPEF